MFRLGLKDKVFDIHILITQSIHIHFKPFFQPFYKQVAKNIPIKVYTFLSLNCFRSYLINIF